MYQLNPLLVTEGPNWAKHRQNLARIAKDKAKKAYEGNHPVKTALKHAWQKITTGTTW